MTVLAGQMVQGPQKANPGGNHIVYVTSQINGFLKLEIPIILASRKRNILSFSYIQPFLNDKEGLFNRDWWNNINHIICW